MSNLNINSLYHAINSVNPPKVEINKWGQRYVRLNDKECLKINQLVDIVFNEIKITKNRETIRRGKLIGQIITNDFLDPSKVQGKGNWISFQHWLRSLFGGMGSGRSEKLNEIKNIRIKRNVARSKPAHAQRAANPQTTATIHKSRHLHKAAAQTNKLGIAPQPTAHAPKSTQTDKATGSQKNRVQANKTDHEAAAQKKYDEIIANYEIKGGTLHFKNGQTEIDTGLTPNVLLTAIRKGIELGSNAQKFTVDEGGTTYKFYASQDLSKLYFVQKKIGKGVFGRVFKTVELNKAALKAFKKTHPGEKNKPIDKLSVEIANECAQNEYTVLKKLNSKGPQDGIPTPPSKVFYIASSRDQSVQLALFGMDLMAGDLKDTSIQRKFNALDQKEQFHLLRSLISGLNYMHEKGLVHRDLKPENCLAEVGADGKPTKFKLGDFGLATGETPSYKPDYQNDVYKITKTVIWMLLGGEEKIKQGWHEWNLSKESELKFASELKQRGVPQDLIDVLRKGVLGKDFKTKKGKIKPGADYTMPDMLRDYDAALKNNFS